jgi:hypothetical protein
MMMMDNDSKIDKWISDMEEEGKERDEIARGVFVSKRSDGTFTVYRLGKSGKSKYKLDVYIGAENLDEMGNE